MYWLQDKVCYLYSLHPDFYTSENIIKHIVKELEQNMVGSKSG
jgi:hypothetical protein